jgi:hypothetical protein
MPKMLSAVVIFLCIAVVVVAAHAAVKAPKPLDLTQVVEAIRQVEAWDGKATGADGERGPWQFTRDTWREFSTKPFWWASGPMREHKAEQHRVAMAYVEWIHDHLVHIPLQPTAHSIALVYTCGWTGVKHGKPSKAKRDYAQRVQNIYDELTSN